MSNRFHNKFHRHNHHTRPTDRTGAYPDAAYDPIASPDSPFQGEFRVDGDVTTLSSLSAQGDIFGTNGNFHGNVFIKGNLDVEGESTILNTVVQTTSALSITNTGTGPALTVTQTGTQPIAHFIDSNGDDIVFADNGYVGLGTYSPNQKLTVVGGVSATDVYYDKNGNSNNWNSVYSSTAKTSANWDSVYSSTAKTSANWDSVYSSVKSASASWNSVYSSTAKTSANWDSVYSSVKSASANWDSVYSSVRPVSANWNSVYSSTAKTSANWDSVYSSTAKTSANWDSTYSSVKQVSANWDSTYSSVRPVSANWNSVYSSAASTSAVFLSATSTGLSANYVPKYNGNKQLTNSIVTDDGSKVTVGGNLTVTGNLTALGTSYFANTVFSTSSALSVVSNGTGPALFVYQSAGPSDIASFYDGDGVEVLHVGGTPTPGVGGKIGINSGNPNKELTVKGSISASGDVYATKFYGDGSSLSGVNTNTSDTSKLPLSGGTLTGSLSVLGTNGFINYLTSSSIFQTASASAVYVTRMSPDGRYQVVADRTTGLKISQNYGTTFAAGTTGAVSWVSLAMTSDATKMWATSYSTGIYQSSNYGSSWALIAGQSSYFTSNNLMGICASDDGNYVYVSKNYDYIYKVTGQNFASPTLISSVGFAQWVSIACSSTGQYILCTGVSGGSGKIAQSSDYGANWTTQTLTGALYNVSNGVCMSNSGQYQTYIKSSGQLRVSNDYGVSFSDAGPSASWLGCSMNGDGKYQIAWTSTSLYVSQNYGVTWNASSFTSTGLAHGCLSDDGAYFLICNAAQIYKSVAQSDVGNIVIGQGDLVLSGGDISVMTGNVSAVKFYGDGSSLTGITGGGIDATKLSLSGGTLTGGLLGTTASFDSKLSVYSSSNTQAAVTINQTGTAPALIIEDSTSPDNTPVTFNADGRVIIGGLSAFNDATGTAPRLQIQQEANGSSRMGMWTFSQDSGDRGIFSFNKSSASTLGSASAVSINDDLGSLEFNGYDKATVPVLRRAAMILSEVDGVPLSGSVPGRISFFTTLSGSTDVSEKMRITHDGNVGIGTTTPKAELTVVGDVSASGTFFARTNAGVVIGSQNVPQIILRDELSATTAYDGTNRWAAWVGTATPTTGKPFSIGPQNSTGTGAPMMTFTRTSSSGNGKGYIGIGTTDPSETLTLNGTFNLNDVLQTTTGLTNAFFGSVHDGAFDGNGNLFVADFVNNNIRKITPAGIVTVFAGSTTGIAGNTNGTGTAARFNTPLSIAIDTSNNLFVTDTTNHCIRKITPAGVVTTFAGSTAGVSGFTNATGTAARFNFDGDKDRLDIDSSNNLFVIDYNNSVLRKVTSAGVVTTFADISTGWFFDLAIDSSNNIFLPDYFNNLIIKITSAAVISTFAGNGSLTDADGTGVAAGIGAPERITIDSNNNLYVYQNYVVRKITSAAVVTRIAGAYSTPGYVDGTGTAIRFDTVQGMFTDSSDNLFIADQNGVCIRKLNSSVVSSLWAGHPVTTGTTDGVRLSSINNGKLILNQPIASLMDAVTCDSGFVVAGNVGIGTSSPNQKLSVIGSVSATKFYGDGSSLTGITGAGGTDTTKLPLSGGTLTGALTGTVGVFTTHVSAAKFYGDGSNLTGITGTLAGGTLTAALSAPSLNVKMTASTYGSTWNAKDSVRDWSDVGISNDGTLQIATAYGGYIYVSTDSGNTWTAKDSIRNWQAVAMSSNGTIRTAGVYGGQLYVSTDSGATWTAKDSNRNWYSITMSSDGTKQTAAAYLGQLYVSTDSGATWTAKDSNRNWYAVAMSDDGVYRIGAANPGFLYVSTDSGATWTAKDSSRAWVAVSISGNGRVWAAVNYGGQIYISTDSGNTWTAKESNRYWRAISLSYDGTQMVAAVGNSSGGVTGQIYTSIDSGNTWTAKESNRAWRAAAITSDGNKIIAAAFGGQLYVCNNIITGNIQTDGKILIGTSEYINNWNTNQNLIIAGKGNVGIVLNNYSSLSGGGTDGPVFVFTKTRGLSADDSSVPVQQGDDLGTISFAGKDGTKGVTGAQIRSEVDGTVSTGVIPGRITFSTGASSTGTLTEVMRIDSEGNVGIGAVTPKSKLAVKSFSNTQPAVTIVQLGTANALVIEDSTSPDSTPFVVDADGNVLMGLSATFASPFNHPFQISRAGSSGITLARFTNDTTQATLRFAKSRGTVNGTFGGGLSAGDNIGVVDFYGDSGALSATKTAWIANEADGLFTASSAPSRFTFATTASGSTTPTERLRITHAGNVGIGTNAPAALLDVADDVLINGVTVGRGNNGAISNTALGWQALSSSGPNDLGNTALGERAMWSLSGGADSSTWNYHNVAVGDYALAAGKTGILYNTAVGHYAMAGALSAATSNTAIGRYALLAPSNNFTGDANVAIGVNSMYYATSAAGNIAVGNSTLQQIDGGAYNVAIGHLALSGTTSGNSNIGVGRYTLAQNVSGSYNVSIGESTLFRSVSSYNVAIGISSGSILTTGSKNVLVGYDTETSVASGYNQIAIGYNATGVADNTTVIGNDETVATILKGYVGIGTDEPDRALIIEGTSGVSSDVILRSVEPTVTTNNGPAFIFQNKTNAVGGYARTGNYCGVIDARGFTTDVVLTATYTDGYYPFANMAFISEGNFNDKGTAHGGILFSTALSGSRAERMRIAGSGNVGIGTTTPSEKFTVNGTFNLDDALYTTTPTQAQFENLRGGVVDTNGNVFVTDYISHCIKKITPTGTVSTFAGAVDGTSGTTNGTGTAARFNFPVSITIDTSNNLFVLDYGNHCVRKITSAGVVTTFAGSNAGVSGFTNATGTAARFNFSATDQIDIDSSNSLFVCEFNNAAVRKITSAGVVTTFKNMTTKPYIHGVAIDSSNNVFLSDWYNNQIIKITSAGLSSVFAGSGTPGDNTDGIGIAAGIDSPDFLTIDSNNNLYVSHLNALRKITPSGNVTYLAGNYYAASYQEGTGTGASFYIIGGLFVDKNNYLYVTDSTYVGSVVRKVDGISQNNLWTTSLWAGDPINFSPTGGTTGLRLSSLVVDKIVANQSFTSLTDAVSCEVNLAVKGRITSTNNAVFGNGVSVGNGNVNALRNTAVGYGSLANFTSTTTEDTWNTAIGYCALESLSGTGGVNYNTAVGAGALRLMKTGSWNTAVGLNALIYNNASSNTAVGTYASQGNTTGTYNVAVGTMALYSNVTGSSNTAVGKSALESSVYGDENTAFGTMALSGNVSGYSNVAVGVKALQSNRGGTDNIAIGNQSGQYNISGIWNVAIGSDSLKANLSSYNVAVGTNTLETNTIGQWNTAIGTSTLGYNTVGNRNTGLGHDALGSNTNGTGNTAIGSSAMNSLLSGNYNTCVGYNTDTTGASAYNQIAIGYGAVAPANNTAVIGNTSISATLLNGRVGIGDISPAVALDVIGDIYYTGTITDVSDRRLKENILPLESSLTKICALSGYSYTLIADHDLERTSPEIGLIAQDVQLQFPEAVKIIDSKVDKDTGEAISYLGVSYPQLIAPIIESIKELKGIVDGIEPSSTSVEEALTVSKDTFGAVWNTTSNAGSAEWVDVAMSSDGKYRTAVAYKESLYVSTDYGTTWLAKSLPGLNWFSVSMSTDGQIQMATVDGEDNSYIYVSTDYGTTWTATGNEGDWGKISVSANGRIASVIEITEGKIYRTFNSGVTWSTNQASYNLYTDVSVSSDGKVQSATIQGAGIHVSTDYGTTWTLRSNNLLFRSISVSSNGKYQTAVIGDGVTAGDIYVSSNYGTDWTVKQNSKLWSSVAVSSTGKYQVAATEASGSSEIYTSIDFGNTWIAKYIQTETGLHINGCAITSDGKGLAACGKNYSYSSSADLVITTEGKEKVRIDGAGGFWKYTPEPINKNAAALLTLADIQSGIITCNGTSYALTLPTETDLNAGSPAVNTMIEFSIINIASESVTVNAPYNIVGSSVVTSSASGRFGLRKASTGFVCYRLA